MPELPEVETVRRGLAPVMEGAVILDARISRRDLRFPFPSDFCRRLTGKRIVSVGRRAKYLVCDLDDGLVLFMHLGMSGSFRIVSDQECSVPGRFHHQRSQSIPHDHVVFELENPTGKFGVIYNDPRRFGFMGLVKRADFDQHPLFCKLGVEPTGNQLNEQLLAELLAGRTTSLKSALLDQRLIAGIGNIYACEALWRARLSPRRSARTITRKDGSPTRRCKHLCDAIRSVIEEAIEAGGSSLRDHRQTNGSLGYFQHCFNVYDREGHACLRPECSAVIRRIVQSGRSTFYCPACQR